MIYLHLDFALSEYSASFACFVSKSFTAFTHSTSTTLEFPSEFEIESWIGLSLKKRIKMKPIGLKVTVCLFIRAPACSTVVVLKICVIVGTGIAAPVGVLRNVLISGDIITAVELPKP